jgi:hypothetical protein
MAFKGRARTKGHHRQTVAPAHAKNLAHFQSVVRKADQIGQSRRMGALTVTVMFTHGEAGSDTRPKDGVQFNECSLDCGTV